MMLIASLLTNVSGVWKDGLLCVHKQSILPKIALGDNILPWVHPSSILETEWLEVLKDEQQLCAFIVKDCVRACAFVWILFVVRGSLDADNQ